MRGRYRFTAPAREVGWGDNKRTQPPVDIEIEVVIDVDRIAKELANKLARAKGTKSNAMGGLVFAKVIKRQQVAA